MNSQLPKALATMRCKIIAIGLTLISSNTWAKDPTDVLIKMTPGAAQSFNFRAFMAGDSSAKAEVLGLDWVHVETRKNIDLNALKKHPSVLDVQPNYKVRLMHDYKVQDQALRKQIAKLAELTPTTKKPDNPAIPSAPANTTGADPLLSQQWGMNDVGAQEAWKLTKGNPEIIVAVIDTGVDYTHEDLLPNLWRNPKETGLDSQGRDKATNGIDDDGNGYIDDTIGWDFVANDNKPYDLSTEPLQLLLGGGNPGHGTHCAGNVAARGENGKGISGVAPNVKIMSLRFISEEGQGTTADAIKAIRYAVDNGAKITSNSWGSVGEDPAAGEENRALREAVQYSQDHGVLFVAAAGNGHQGKGYDNDADSKPAYPASYDHDIIISVAALDIEDNLGSFSNWGRQSVDIGAPGVKVFSTTVESQYSDTVLDVLGITVYWDGTSMATPHVAGAAALYWSLHPTKTWQQVKSAIIGSARKIPSMTNKSVSGGKLDVQALMKL